MNPEELAKILTDKGYEVKSIRIFKHSFHVNFWTKECKVRAFIKIPIEQYTKKDAERL